MLARCDAGGALADDNGRVEIRYKAHDGKSYRALVKNLEPVAGEAVLPDTYCGAAAPASEQKADASGSARASTSGARGPARVAKKAGAPRTGVRADAKLVAYTDGACSGNPGPCGLGVVLLEQGARRELSEYLGIGTNNIAELTAILRALEALGRSSEPVIVYTDSQYAIGVLTKGWKAKANQALIGELKERITQFPALELAYVPGHAGVPLNERADALARAAVSARGSSGWVEVKGGHERLG